MKKIVLSILTIAFSFSFAQSGIILSKDNMLEGSMLHDMVTSAKAGRSLKYDDILGSPYSNQNFSKAKIAEDYEMIQVRYNSYSDEVEFKNENGVMVLPKENKFSKIEILSPKQTLIFVNTKDDLNGYFYELLNGKTSLYKKIKTKFIDVIPASSSYASEKPATFKNLDPIYYIKTEKGFIKNPKNKKEIIEQLPEKKEVLNTFFSQNKIKFDKEEDLKKLVTFLNQN
ncbi:hypothetical protein HIO71_17520 [Chryseobacterium aquaticum]|uniref:Uncharacterized protein n=1 Tax=Chryseobacterium aquaticum TaxID=452084 RepID=A0A848NBZ4_9FLAO|nr:MULTISPECIES: hypothetical protein [Chryseobacterium]NMR35981.1 hypothetical protein [Chryseobacterium aquaticum]NRQ48056.1 hypothetical protein [Chryseobacterium sp. C-204]